MERHEQPPPRPAMAMVGGRFVAALPELFQQIGAQRARVGKLFQFHARELLQLGVGVVGSALFADAGSNLLHDLLDVNRVRSHV